MTTFDKAEWHREIGGEHIALYVDWLIRVSLVDPSVIAPRYVPRGTRRQLDSDEILEAVDQRLSSSLMTAEGEAFTAARYSHYLEVYASLASRSRTPATHRRRVFDALDGMFAAWKAAGRPAGTDVAAPPRGTPGFDSEPYGTQTEVARVLRESAYLEGDAILPSELSLDAALSRLSRHTARTWGSARLRRAAIKAGSDPDAVTVWAGVVGEGDEGLAVAVYRLPGARPGALREAARELLELPTGGTWRARSIDGTEVALADGPEFSAAYWVRDDRILHVGGPSRASVLATVHRWISDPPPAVDERPQ